MNEQLRTLIKLQKLDTEIIARNNIIRAIPSKISFMEKPLKNALSELDTQHQKYEAAEKKKRDRERRLDEINERINKLKTRTAGIKDNKAYQAHLKEIEAAEKERSDSEDEILALMETVEAAGKEVKAAEVAVQKEKQKVAEVKEQLEAEVKEAETHLNELRSRRKELAAPLDSEIYDLYMSLLKTRGGLAVVEARNAVCQGCNMNIMLQLFVEIKQDAEIIHCPQCRRILYYSEP